MRTLLGLFLAFGLIGSAAADRWVDWANLVDDTQTIGRDYMSSFDSRYPVRQLEDHDFDNIKR